MSALNYLDNLRARPERERRHLAWLFASLITALIVGVWLLNLYLTGAWGLSAGQSGKAVNGTSWRQTQSVRWHNIQAGIVEGWRVIIKREAPPAE
ncbi:MAG: hypothetical protein U9M92_02285 [Patescibacteria group bacterium]|nr:hypothetical protein [Patescibacteria group bacterium]